MSLNKTTIGAKLYSLFGINAVYGGKDETSLAVKGNI
jgi:hypothetical protein